MFLSDIDANYEGCSPKAFRYTLPSLKRLIKYVLSSGLLKQIMWSLQTTTYILTLLWAQCDPNHSGAEQRFPLSQAIRSGDDRALEQLLQARADPTLQEPNQNAPLLLAIEAGAPSYVRLLLQYKADPEITESAPKGNASSPMGSMVQRQTASDLASPFPDILEILQDACIVHHMP